MADEGSECCSGGGSYSWSSEERYHGANIQGGRKGSIELTATEELHLYTSTVSKVLKFLLLERLEMVFMESGLPHINQSVYQKGISCSDAIFVTQEAIAMYLKGGSPVYMCLYDLQKAFDSVEYPVLLEKLYNAVVNGKMWRLLKSWYI